MRLFDAKALVDDNTFLFVSSVDAADTVKYAILSHRWFPAEEEVTFQDVAQGTGFHKAGFLKIRGFCMKAIAYGYRYVWVDTCCIDKTSSTELSEAINSMFVWYRDSALCIAYLDDVDGTEIGPDSPFQTSKWFTRGWTLQELLAPQKLVFFEQNWMRIGSKATLAFAISTVTRIDSNILTYRARLADLSVATRMSWASTRQTTRVEDRAYSLLGIFGINMPTIYGEKEQAFFRLQLEIIRGSDDHSIFAWFTPIDTPRILELDDHMSQLKETSRAIKDKDLNSIGEFHPSCSGLLAKSPSDFKYSSDIVAVPHWFHARILTVARMSDYTMTNSGLRIRLPLLPVARQSMGFAHNDVRLALLACTLSGRTHGLIAIALMCTTDTTQFIRIRTDAAFFKEITRRTLHNVTADDYLFVDSWRPSVDFARSMMRKDPPGQNPEVEFRLKLDCSFLTVQEHAPADHWVSSTIFCTGDSVEYGNILVRDTPTDTLFVVYFGIYRRIPMNPNVSSLVEFIPWTDADRTHNLTAGELISSFKSIHEDGTNRFLRSREDWMVAQTQFLVGMAFDQDTNDRFEGDSAEQFGHIIEIYAISIMAHGIWTLWDYCRDFISAMYPENRESLWILMCTVVYYVLYKRVIRSQLQTNRRQKSLWSLILAPYILETVVVPPSDSWAIYTAAWLVPSIVMLMHAAFIRVPFAFTSKGLRIWRFMPRSCQSLWFLLEDLVRMDLLWPSLQTREENELWVKNLRKALTDAPREDGLGHEYFDWATYRLPDGREISVQVIPTGDKSFDVHIFEDPRVFDVADAALGA